MSLQPASVSQGRNCSDNCTCCGIRTQQGRAVHSERRVGRGGGGGGGVRTQQGRAVNSERRVGRGGGVVRTQQGRAVHSERRVGRGGGGALEHSKGVLSTQKGEGGEGGR